MAYGDCPGGSDDECLQDEVCVTGTINNVDYSICTGGTCNNDGDCDVQGFDDGCNNLPGDGEWQDYCVPVCGFGQSDCPDGMQCAQGQGGGVCLWPDN